MNRRIFSLLVCLCMVLTMLPALPAAAANQLASYYGTNEVGNGVKTTITVDGDISDWSSAMLVAQGTANDDPRVYRPNSMYENPIDLYALYAAYDNENLYLMWEMTNVQDVVAPNDTYPLSQGVLFQTMNIPLFIAIDTGDAATAIGNDGKLTTGGTIWNSGITFDQSFNKLIATSTNGSNGPFLYGGTSAGLNPKEELAYKNVPMTFKYGLGILSKNVYGIDKAYGEYNDRLVGDMCNEDAAWVDFNTLGHSSSTMDFHYEMSISLEALGVTADDVAKTGLGVMLVMTSGQSGMDCLPYDLSMNDLADLDDAAGSQENNSFEKSDEDHITASFARVGGSIDPTEPTEKPTQKPSDDPSEPSSEPTEPSEPDAPIDPPLPPVPPEPSYPQGVVYLKASNDWKVDGARFAAYFWDGNGKEVWVDATDADGDGYYEAAVPDGCTNVIFVRLNPATIKNEWVNKWNQTDDLTVPTDNKIAFILDAGWNNTGHWETYLPADWECPHASHNQNGVCTECGETVEHTYTSKVTPPTCTADGYTTYTCSVCGKNYADDVVTTKGHSYIDGTCTVCGTADPNYKPVVEKFDIAFSQIDMGNALGMNFAFPAVEGIDFTGAYAEATMAGNVQTIPADKWTTATIGGKAHYVFSYSNIAAKQMADEVTIVIYNANDEALSNEYVDSIQAYVMRNVDGKDAESKALMIDMLNYGAAAQVYYGYNTTDLANGQLTDAQKAYGTAELTEITDIRVKGANYLGTRLELGSSIGMQMNFVGTTADMYAVIEFTNHSGKKISERVAPTEISGNYLINITQVAVADGRMPITVTVYNADGSIHGYATDSMTSYIARMSNADSLYENIMKFSDSAYAYLH